MWASSRRALNFLDRKTPNQERVSNQRTMTAPRHRLSAHQCNSLLPGMRDQLVQSNLKLRRLHVVCIPSEALVDRKSTRLNSSHGYISYAVFCLKKKKNKHNTTNMTVHNSKSTSK